MPNWTINDAPPQTIAILLFPRFSNHCLANAVEPLRAVNEMLGRDHYHWQFVTLDGAAVRSSSGLPVLPDGRLSDHTGGDFLFVASSYDAAALSTVRTARALRAAAKRFDTLVGMDTGSWVLAHAGLLDDHRATIHWDEMVAFGETFPQVEVISDRFVRSDTVLSCGGAMTTFDLVLDLIRATHGEAMKLAVAAYFLASDTPHPTPAMASTAASPLVRSCIAMMSDHVETPLKLTGLAAHLGTTPRTLSRHFWAAYGATPQTVYKRIRLMAARRFAQQTQVPVAEIAVRCGYQNAAAMTRAFVAEFGQTPSALRRGRA